MRFTTLALACALSAPGAFASSPCVPDAAASPPIVCTYVGYTVGTDVTQHGRIDLDTAAIATHANAAEWTEALAVYTDGQNSAKSSSLRNLKAFSNNDDKLKIVSHHSLAKAEYGSAAWADEYVLPLFAAGTTPTTLATAINFLVTVPYVFYEMVDAVTDCDAGTADDNDNAVHAWDEAVAFYVGSTGLAETASNASPYGMIASLGAAGNALNEDIMALLTTGGANIDALECKTAAEKEAMTIVMESIHGKILAAAIRLLKVAQDASDTSTAAALTKFILPEIAACNHDKADTFAVAGEIAYLKVRREV